MQTSLEGRSLIESFEGLALKAYADQRGIATLGYGHTLGVKLGDTCTTEQADAWLEGDLGVAEGAVNALGVDLSQNQYDACVSLAFNIGAHAFSKSTVSADIRAGHFDAAAVAFLMWNRTNGNINPGLQRRREAEKSLFLTPDA